MHETVLEVNIIFLEFIFVEKVHLTHGKLCYILNLVFGTRVCMYYIVYSEGASY